MSRGTVVVATAAVLWCVFVIATTYLPGVPAFALLTVYLPGFLVVPVFVATLLRARSQAIFCLAHVPKPLLVGGFLVALGGWLFSCGALRGLPGTETLSAVAGLVIVLHVAFGLIAIGMVRLGR
ncbi:hypothetical protein GCM10022243_46730 [Saccharothrix violaceirubra]|uniref:Uncharacterized protein n=1 Tax=Saccharothrix violaceirubra TaxID=413306 RepID=A0A7W7WY88_9PSEU|nr:hypothetical protein [Saccharothrix violaceirubra]MBB4967786.1 hypothetical protein [Saccharothrix violaceirubra]